MSPINLYEPFSGSPSKELSECYFQITSGTLHINKAALPINKRWIYEKLQVERLSYQL